MNIGNETETIEFKKSTSEVKEGLISISSMLNKHGKGLLYFGVKNNGEVSGQQIGERTLTELSEKISSSVKPVFLYEINQRNTTDGKTFIEVSFSGDRQPYSAFGRYYLRYHDEDRQMDNEQLRAFYLSQRKDYNEWEMADSGCPIDDTDEALLQEYVDEAKRHKRLRYQYTDKETMLGKLGLLYQKSRLNNAGNVLFSAKQPVRLKLAKFASDTRLTILALEIFDGNVFECIRKAMDFYSENVDWNIVLDGGIKRREQPEIPLEAIREIVVNAFSHGDYHANTDFELDIYSNRVCIYSPGQFPKPYTPEQFATEAIEPIPLNIKISDVLFRNGTIEQISTGFERAFHLCRKYDIAYSYTETANGFRFVFYRNGKTANERNEIEKTIINAIAKNEKTTAASLAKEMDVSERTVQRWMKKLKTKGVLERVGNNGNGYWRVVE